MDYHKAKIKLKAGKKVTVKGEKAVIELKNGEYMSGKKVVTLDTEAQYTEVKK